jgi:hypothetical protein
VYEELGVPARNGLHYRDGTHDQLATDFHALLDFADLHLNGEACARSFQILPYPAAPPPVLPEYGHRLHLRVPG